MINKKKNLLPEPSPIVSKLGEKAIEVVVLKILKSRERIISKKLLNRGRLKVSPRTI